MMENVEDRVIKALDVLVRGTNHAKNHTPIKILKTIDLIDLNLAGILIKERTISVKNLKNLTRKNLKYSLDLMMVFAAQLVQSDCSGAPSAHLEENSEIKTNGTLNVEILLEKFVMVTSANMENVKSGNFD